MPKLGSLYFSVVNVISIEIEMMLHKINKCFFSFSSILFSLTDGRSKEKKKQPLTHKIGWNDFRRQIDENPMFVKWTSK